MKAASPQASRAAQGASAKRDTQPEVALRAALCRQGLRGYRVDVSALPGRPDVVFRRARVAIFCDGDFWHGRQLEERLAKLSTGHNAPYWTEKIAGNVARDRRNDDELARQGWRVLRFWASRVLREPDVVAREIREVLDARLSQAQRRNKSC